MPQPAPPEALSVSELARRVKSVLDGSFEQVWVRGELSNFRSYSSGHWYFTIKDADAQLKVAMFGRSNRSVRFQPKDGDEVLLRGRIDLYARRGDLQLVASHMEPLGEGRLQRAFEELKARLQQEGLFDPARKRPLPRVPRRIGIVTSEKAAALQDMLRILRERDPSLAITIAPCRVQGVGSGASVAAALALLNEHSDVEVILCGRGGGSLEDLWAFNEEVVARAIAASRIPVISGVGHEIDFTIADFVADARAPTPTAAAESAVPVRAELEAAVQALLVRLGGASQRGLQRRRARITELSARLGTPRRRLDVAHQRLDESRSRLERVVQASLVRRRERLAATHRALNALGPLQSLQRGYAIALRGSDSTVLRDASGLSKGDSVRVRLNRGALECTVESVVPPGDLDLRGRKRSE